MLAKYFYAFVFRLLSLLGLRTGTAPTFVVIGPLCFERGKVFMRAVLLMASGLLFLSPESALAARPDISGVDNVANYVENAAPIVIDSSITITDSDSTQLNRAIVDITTNFSSSQDSLVYSTINGITGSYNSATGELTLTGTATLAQYEQALESVKYQNSSDTPSTATRTISFVVRDTSNSSSFADTTTLTVQAMVEAPVISDVDNVATYVENDPPVVIDPTITITDLDSTQLNQATVTITTNFTSSQDSLVYTTVNGITGSYFGGVLTLAGTATLAQYEQALESVKYQNSAEYPNYAPRTISFVVRDTSNATSTSDTTTLSISMVNDLPVISGVDNIATYVESGPAVVIDSTITITDLDSPQLNWATVSITGNFESTQDVLIYSTINGITGSYDNGTGVLTLSGVAWVGEYEQALESVRYQNTGINLPNGTPPRTITFVGRDVFNDNSAAVATNVNIHVVNSAPVISDVDNVVNYTENDPATIVDSSITIMDADSTHLNQAIVSLSPGGDHELIYSTVNGISGSFNSSTDVLTLSGTASLADYEAALETVKFELPGNESPPTNARTVSFSVRDTDNVTSAADTTTVNVTQVNDLPAISDVDNVANYIQNESPVIIDPTLSVSDIDTPMLNQATVSITDNFDASEDMLVYSTMHGITGSYNSSTGVLTLSGGSPGSLFQYEQALESVRYQNTSQNPSTATRTMSFMVRDIFNGSSPAVTTTLTVTALNAKPVVGEVNNVANYVENGPAVIIDSAITITDIDSTELNQATVSITGNFNDPEDELLYSTVNGITGSYNGGTGVLTLSGTATLAQYEQALESVQYRNTSGTPDVAARTISFTVRDVDNAVSTAVSTTLNVEALPLVLDFEQANQVSAGVWEQLAGPGATVLISGTVDEALGPLSIRAQAGSNILNTTTSNGQFRLALAKSQSSWLVTVTETTVQDRSVSATLNLITDNQPPVVTINGPAARTTGEATITLDGTAQDNFNIVTSAHAESTRFSGQSFAVSLNQNGNFTTELPLALGVNVIKITAIDASGNSGNAQVTVTRQSPVLPVIFIQSPSDGAVIPEAKVDVAGTIYSSQAADVIRIELAGRMQFASTTAQPGVYSFNFNDIPLNEGSNLLTVAVKTPAGNTQQSVTVTHNPNQAGGGGAPVIVIDPVLVNSTVNYDSVTVRGTARSTAGIQTVTVDFVEASLDGADNKELIFSRQVDISGIPGSEITLPVTATDINGVTTTVLLSLFRDTTAPVISVTTPNIQPAPAVNDVVDAPFMLEGTVEDSNLSRFTINGQSVGLVPTATAGRLAFKAEISAPSGQEQILNLEAVDKAGNRTQYGIVVRIDAVVTVEILQPVVDAEFIALNNVTIDVAARLEGLSPGDLVKVRLDNAAAQEMALDANIAMHQLTVDGASAQHSITVEVSNTLGEVIGRNSVQVRVTNEADIPLVLEKTQPASEATNVSVGQFIALFFNKPIDPAELEIEVRETVHGKTWDVTQYEGVDPLQAGNINPIVEVHRDVELVPGVLSIFDGQQAFSYHLQREFAYNADVFVSVSYDGDVIEEFRFKVEPMPTLLLGTVVNQLYQPVAGMEVSLPGAGVTAVTDQQGSFRFGFGDNPGFRLPAGRQKIVFNTNGALTDYGVIESMVNLQAGDVSRIGRTIVPVLSSQLPYARIQSGNANIRLAAGDIKIDASQASFVFPGNNQTAGNVHVQFTTAQQISHKASTLAQPIWVYAVQPQGIEIRGEILIDLLAPQWNGNRNYLPPNGTYVIWVGQDPTTLQVAPVGVGLVQDQHVVTVGPLALKRLDYIGFAFAPEQQQPMLKRYAEGQASLGELIAAFELQARGEQP